ncbi:hypothetical protein JS562_53295, partial [Agrobacterium sp. S2]|nr:hypothetical protein [Agrobacterium sp. S2]
GLVLRASIPALIIWNSPHDDEAEVEIAAALLDGQWLGVWGDQQIPHITLAKGPGYPLFLAMIQPTGLGPHIAAYLVYLAGALILASALRRRIGDGWGCGPCTWRWRGARTSSHRTSRRCTATSSSRPSHSSPSASRRCWRGTWSNAGGPHGGWSSPPS